MSRRDLRPERGDLVPIPPPSKCAKFLYYTWKLCSVVFSHFVMISLVVAYCILGAVTFEKLESQHEKDVKMNISKIRDNTTESIWSMTVQSSCLVPANWTADVIEMLKEFESALLLEMKVRGWDGNESTEHIQWTFTGALFYSIIVITTIGYGHIAPKTQSGKVVTIFYAILGIPLMLLCLSNIGDVMASSFRFLYWRVCCYVCTRPPKRRHRHHHPSRRSVRAAIAGPSGGRGSMRRRKPIERAHSDTDFWYRDSGYSSGRARRGRPAPRTRSQPPGHSRDFGPRDYIDERLPVRGDPYGPEYYDDEPEEFPKVTLPLQDLEAAIKDLEDHHKKLSKQDIRSKSLPRPAKSKPDYGPRRDFDNHGLYDVNDPEDLEMHDLHDVDYENFREKKARELEEGRGDRDDYYGYKDRNYDPDDEDYDFEPRSRKFYSDRDRRYRGRSEYYERDRDDYPDRSRGRRARSAVYERRWEDERDEPRRDVESGRPRRLRRLQTIDDRTSSPEKDDYSDDGIRRSRVPVPATWGSRQSEIYVVEAVPTKEELKPVPIWLCVCLVSSYIVAGTFLFKRWEGWEYLDAAYFCFITLTTIGFGDFVPAQNHNQAGNAADAVHSIALCSLYLLFGIALLAMSFNLVQEQVRASVASLATKLGIIKDKDNDQY